jgi:hypothetical protein
MPTIPPHYYDLDPLSCLSKGTLVEGTSQGHDAIAVKDALPYLEARGMTAAIAHIKNVKKVPTTFPFPLSSAPTRPLSLSLAPSCSLLLTNVPCPQTKDPQAEYLGTGKIGSNRAEFGVIVSDILDKMSKQEKKERVMVIDCDLEVHFPFLLSPPALFLRSAFFSNPSLYRSPSTCRALPA